jgi:hypothetical protein
MDKHFSLSLKQIILMISVTALLAAAIGVLIFYLGQRSSIMNNGKNEPTPSASMPPLPKAMTATPRPEQGEMLIFTEDMLTEAAQSVSDQDLPISIDAIQITPSLVTTNGKIDYMNYQGTVSIAGQPYVQDRRLRVRIISLTLADQPLPALIYPTIEEQINLAFDQILMGYYVDDVTLDDGTMIVSVVPW